MERGLFDSINPRGYSSQSLQQQSILKLSNLSVNPQSIAICELPFQILDHSEKSWLIVAELSANSACLLEWKTRSFKQMVDSYTIGGHLQCRFHFSDTSWNCCLSFPAHRNHLRKFDGQIAQSARHHFEPFGFESILELYFPY